MTFALAGLTMQSSPVSATELASSAIVAAAVQLPVVNVPVEPLVPAVETIPNPIIPNPVIADPVLPATDALRAGDTVAYPTLVAAVAAHQASEITQDVRCLATAIYHESKGEPLAGQLAVAEVIINRSTSGRFPSDVCAVVTQRGQFSFVRGGKLPTVAECAAYRTAVAVARVAMADAWSSGAARALYFNTPNRAPAGRLTRVASIGNHVFYR